MNILSNNFFDDISVDVFAGEGGEVGGEPLNGDELHLHRNLEGAVFGIQKVGVIIPESAALDPMYVVRDGVSFIDDFGLQNFFHDVFECHNSDDFVLGIVAFLFDDSLNHCKMVVALLEFFEHDSKGSVFEDHAKRVIVIPAHGFDGEVIVGIEEGQILDEEQRNDVIPISLEDWDTGVSHSKNLGNRFGVEGGVARKHEDVLQR